MTHSSVTCARVSGCEFFIFIYENYLEIEHCAWHVENCLLHSSWGNKTVLMMIWELRLFNPYVVWIHFHHTSFWLHYDGTHLSYCFCKVNQSAIYFQIYNINTDSNRPCYLNAFICNCHYYRHPLCRLCTLVACLMYFEASDLWLPWSHVKGHCRPTPWKILHISPNHLYYNDRALDLLGWAYWGFRFLQGFLMLQYFNSYRNGTR